jgi:tRNA (cmo5U34)-methyltransferase
MGQTALIDAPLSLDMIAEIAAGLVPNARRILDVGCGAGNYSLALLERLPGCAVDLVDLSGPMLDRAKERVGAATTGAVTLHQEDIRELALAEGAFDVIVAASVLHHLRTDAEWETVFAKFAHTLRPGGVLFVSDMVEHDLPVVQEIMWRRYGDYLRSVGGDSYREKVFAYIAKEDTPRSLMFQLDLMRKVGFSHTDVLHKNAVFAAFFAQR